LLEYLGPRIGKEPDM